MSTTTEHKLIELIRAKAEAKPDFVYEPLAGAGIGNSCVYVDDGKPSCIVGHGAWDAGLIGPEFQLSRHNSDGVIELLEHLSTISEFSGADRAWLEAVQEAQDTGQTWAEAVKTADAARADYIEDLGGDDDD